MKSISSNERSDVNSIPTCTRVSYIIAALVAIAMLCHVHMNILLMLNTHTHMYNMYVYLPCFVNPLRGGKW